MKNGRAGFSRLTRSAYGSVLITKAFDMSVEENGRFGSREAEYLSSGAADQAYLSLRLALSSMIFETSGALPIFLDDSLAQYDDRRAEAAAGFLKEYSADGQVIMFTCHGAVRTRRSCRRGGNQFGRKKWTIKQSMRDPSLNAKNFGCL
ncbi:MAG: ATP-binding protein [Oscillospiraceae bacterium]